MKKILKNYRKRLKIQIFIIKKIQTITVNIIDGNPLRM